MTTSGNLPTFAALVQVSLQRRMATVTPVPLTIEVDTAQVCDPFYYGVVADYKAQLIWAKEIRVPETADAAEKAAELAAQIFARELYGGYLVDLVAFRQSYTALFPYLDVPGQQKFNAGLLKLDEILERMMGEGRS